MARGLKPLSLQDIINNIYDGTLQGIGVYQTPVGTFYAGSNATVTGTAGTLGIQACSEVIVQADPGNGTVDILVGDSGSQVFWLVPGADITLPVSNVNLVYVKTDTGTGTASWLALKQVVL